METTLTFNFRLIRLLDHDLVPGDCEIILHLGLSQEGDTEIQENCLKAIKFWLDTILDSSIVYWPGTDVDTKLFEKISNNIILTPEEPNDYHMCLLLHSKINAIGQGHVLVNKTEFASDTGDGFKCAFSGDIGPWLSTERNWMGVQNIFEQPWWLRKDGSTLDIPYEDGDDIVHIKESLTIDLLEILGSKTIDSTNQSAEIIKPAFKLKLIKDDE